MVNKKAAIELSIGTIIIIVLAISMLVLGMVLVKNIFSDPDIRVTFEECRNETGEYDGYDCSDGLLRIPMYAYYGSEIENFTMIDGIFCYKKHNIWEREVCEKVEVDYIEYSITTPSNCQDVGDGVVGGCVAEIQTFHNISKEEITIDFLDENCEVLKINNEDLKYFDGYECNDYKVEVLK